MKAFTAHTIDNLFSSLLFSLPFSQSCLILALFITVLS